MFILHLSPHSYHERQTWKAKVVAFLVGEGLGPPVSRINLIWWRRWVGGRSKSEEQIYAERKRGGGPMSLWDLFFR